MGAVYLCPVAGAFLYVTLFAPLSLSLHLIYYLLLTKVVW